MRIIEVHLRNNRLNSAAMFIWVATNFYLLTNKAYSICLRDSSWCPHDEKILPLETYIILKSLEHKSSYAKDNMYPLILVKHGEVLSCQLNIHLIFFWTFATIVQNHLNTIDVIHDTKWLIELNRINRNSRYLVLLYDSYPFLNSKYEYRIVSSSKNIT